jgi:hypothetical protein
MSQLDELLARSRAPANYKNRKHFTLSREKAIEKQREFALRNPKTYVLEIIQGAIFAGATYMAVDARKHDILIAWVGAPPLSRDELENLTDYLFASNKDKRVRHLRQLAVGINAIFNQRPKSIRLESGADGSCIRLEMGPDGKASIGEVENPIEGTYLIAEFDGGWMGRFGFGSSQWTDVGKLIEDRCLYTPVPILLNGNAPFGFRATRNIEIFGARDQEQFDEGERRGVVALHSSTRAPRGFRIVVGGVWIMDKELGEMSDQQLVGVICDDSLRKTADHATIVEDEAYLRMLHAAQPHTTALIRRALNAAYVPPVLPPVPPEEEEENPASPAPAKVTAEPVPEVIPMVGARGTTSMQKLLGSDDQEPVFWCTAEVARAIEEARVADALRFPFRLLVLTEGQAYGLGRDLPQLGLHHLDKPNSIDVILKMMERGIEIRTVTVPLPNGVMQVRLHRRGRVPSWGNGRPGTPILIRRRGRSVDMGSVDGNRVYLNKVEPRQLKFTLGLPRLSLVIESDERDFAFTDEVAGKALTAAWQVAAPEHDEPDEDLLAALLGHEAQPQFAEDPHPVGQQRHPDAEVVLGAALPPSWPSRLRHVPLAQTPEGPLTLERFLEVVRHNEVAWVRDQAEVDRMVGLERRFGFGHIARYGVDEPPLFAVAHVGSRWIWVKNARFFDEGTHFTHLVYVAPHLGVRSEDHTYEQLEQPARMLLAVKRRDAPHRDLTEAWEMLYQGLRRLELENLWPQQADPARVDRARSLGRLALLHLATRVEGALDDAVLLPSDGGARWSIQRLRNDPKARVSAANGVVVAEPTTFCLLFQAYRAVSPRGQVRLRYDDHPDVWRSLAETSSEGWLLRTEITEVRLKGWLGLRKPYDATAGILLRTTGTLLGLPELERRIPCHGLLWPTGGSDRLTEGERQLLQLAGLRMYAQLVDLLKGRLDPASAKAARLYAWVFCHRAHTRGRLTGTALQLARQVEVFSEDGRTWGTLDRWLETPAGRRPDPPPEIALPEAPADDVPAHEGIQGPTLSALADRLNEILPHGLAVEVRAGDLGVRTAPVAVVARGPTAELTVELNTERSFVADAVKGEGPARELLLLEMARKLAQWGDGVGESLSLVPLQQMLLSQRFED